MLKISLLRRFFGKVGDEARPGSTLFIDRVPEAARSIYGERSLVICNGAAIFVVSEGRYVSEMLNHFPRERWGLRTGTPDWKKLMRSLRPASPMVPMTFTGRPVTLRGTGASNPSSALFAPSWNSHPSKWLAINVLFVDMAKALGLRFVARQEDETLGGPPIPVMGRPKAQGPIVVMGCAMKVRLDSVKMEQEELFCRAVSDDTGKELRDGTVQATSA